MPGTEGTFLNGIELNPDGREIILNLYMGNEVRRISRESGEILARREIVKPDNVTWSTDGRLLIASHSGGSLPEQMACNGLEEGACPFGFDIGSLDPETLEGEIVFSNAGPPMGAGTGALDVGGELLIGSFAGDRIIRVVHGPRLERRGLRGPDAFWRL